MTMGQGGTFGYPGLPGDRYVTPRTRLASMLASKNYNNGSTMGGLAHLAQMLVLGNALRKDRADEKAANAALVQGMSAKPWTPPDETLQYGSPNGPTMTRAEAMKRAAPAGGLEGGKAALLALPEDNQYAGRLTQGLLMRRAEREMALQDAERRRNDDLFDYEERKRIDQKFAVPKERRIIKGADGFQYYDDGSRVLPNVEQVPGAPFSGTGIEAQALNNYMTLSEKQRQGIALTPQEQMALELSRQRLERPSTLQTPQGTEITPGYNLAPQNQTPPHQGFDKLGYKGQPGRTFIPRYTAEQEAVGKVLAKRLEGVNTQADAAQSTLDALAQFEAGSANFETGAFGGARASLGAFANLLGVDPATLNLGDTASAESIRAAANTLALKARSLGGGMPGAMSDKDLKFLTESVPSLTNTPQGNRRIIDYMRRAATRTLERRDAMMQWYQQKGTTQGFDAAWRNHVNSNPLFTDQDRQGLGGAGVSVTAPKENPMPGVSPEAILQEYERRRREGRAP